MIHATRVHCLTVADFEALSPWSRGYVVALYGSVDARPHIPSETNPFAAGSLHATAWTDGQAQAKIDEADLWTRRPHVSEV